MTISATSQGLKPGVCTSTNRPANPFDGMMIYETDTDKVAVYDVNAWVYKTAASVAGSIVQVVNATTVTQVASSSSTYATIGLTATITPTLNTSKILVLASCNGLLKNNANAGNGNNCRLLRGATNISDFGLNLGYTGTTLYSMTTCSVSFLDSPATTSATTYVVHGANSANTGEIFFQRDGQMSTITLMEVKV